ncbi:prolyl oligopeptidase family serine peptidase [Flavobacterium paronense]|uniref:Prolyl oligopeptidase family serine peptidase n=1 Tax=Flavobacterium paronense TaxID=1392775 RepID=A0ABV5GH06_9FLAO|nr:prolyl oligopeptidase family serine peptidase [Flavobacterium paronense]MDN3677294.1 prolyl oligopeptidase family serine peptidase [Flavobacterium paronense]
MRLKQSLLILLIGIPFIGVSQDIEGNFSVEIKTQYSYGFLLHKPENNKEKKPLIVFLHGDGEKGTDIEKVKIHGPFNYLQTHTIDAYVLAPQCRENTSWDSESLYLLIQKVQKENNIDGKRIYLTGLSSGGWGAWNLALVHPELFAALVPISSYVDLNEQDYACKLKDMPTRIFHGLLDDVVNPEFPISMYKILKSCNATNVKLTIFEDENHGCWTKVYNNQEIYDWMLQQIKKP